MKDVCSLMDEAGNFKLSRPNTFLNIRHYSYICNLIRIIITIIYVMIMLIFMMIINDVQTKFLDI